MHPAITQNADELTVDIKVVPGSSKNAWTSACEEAIRIKIAAAPEDGKANAALIKFIAQSLGCRKAEVAIVSGAHSRLKRVKIPARVLDSLSKLIT